MRFRRLNRLYAAAFGYFWRECPACGQGFGDHEWKDQEGYLSSIPCYSCDNPGHDIAICPNCTRQGVGHDRFS